MSKNLIVDGLRMYIFQTPVEDAQPDLQAVDPRWAGFGEAMTDDRLVDDVDGLMLITGGPQGPRWIPGGQEGPDRRPIGG